MKIIDGKILDTIIKGGSLKVIDGSVFDTFGIDEAEVESITPIAYMKYYDGSSVLTIPIYNTTDISYNALRINTPYGIGCFNLISLDSSLSSEIRISTSAGVKSIAKL